MAEAPPTAPWWHQVTTTVTEEFSDVPDAGEATRIVVRLAVAAVLGGLLGWEREHAGKAAGIRTHMLVAMGAALFVLVAQQVGISAADNSRVIQGIVAGVGFLGAGTILKGDAEHQVKGLTTAAGIWLTAAIGVAAGLGREVTAVLSAVLALAVLWAIPLVHEAAEDKGPQQHPPRSDDDSDKNKKHQPSGGKRAGHAAGPGKDPD
ncbi:putative Mg2+ transporter-C (MgtC) family protein [Acidovorax soli]|uniref:Protein MgtC n=1 Tax=Acidovorax soli TaxID=592050 RepID=A0A7X0PLV9_9BURK|nr:MgtC/SapB family protein [Acidovorax soli]MBB6564034.1 putative Mg2+ transporter-C (MgtC) family protein [Acidovorax soli]